MLGLVSGLVAFGCVAAALDGKDSRLLIVALVALGINVASAAFGLWLRSLNGGVPYQTQVTTRDVMPVAPFDGSDEDVRSLVRNGRKIDAIKLYRTRHNVGLKEAKEAVEQM